MAIRQTAKSSIAELRDRIGGLPKPADPEEDIRRTADVFLLLVQSVGVKLPNQRRTQKAFENESRRVYRRDEQPDFERAIAEATGKDIER